MISAMGLYGLTALRVEQRTKEIGIRKVLGGSIFQMIQLIVKEFVVLIIIAGCFALPLGYYFATQILQQFAYSTKVTWLDGITALALALFIAVITILIRAQQTAKANPVDLIKVE
jgi:putative ABC transport system permease protein